MLSVGALTQLSADVLDGGGPVIISSDVHGGLGGAVHVCCQTARLRGRDSHHTCAAPHIYYI